jgi:hypothetical protein
VPPVRTLRGSTATGGRGGRDADVTRQVGLVEQVCGTPGAGAQEPLEVAKASDIGERADVALQVRGDVRIGEGRRVNLRVGVQLGEAAAHHGRFEAGQRTGPEDLQEGQRLEFEAVRPASQRLGDAPHEGELLGPGEQELSVSRACGIHGDFQVAEQGRRVLHLVQDDRRRVTPEKGGGFPFSLFGFGRQVQGHEAVPGKQPP